MIFRFPSKFIESSQCVPDERCFVVRRVENNEALRSSSIEKHAILGTPMPRPTSFGNEGPQSVSFSTSACSAFSSSFIASVKASLPSSYAFNSSMTDRADSRSPVSQ